MSTPPPKSTTKRASNLDYNERAAKIEDMESNGKEIQTQQEKRQLSCWNDGGIEGLNKGLDSICSTVSTNLKEGYDSICSSVHTRYNTRTHKTYKGTGSLSRSFCIIEKQEKAGIESAAYVSEPEKECKTPKKTKLDTPRKRKRAQKLKKGKRASLLFTNSQVPVVSPAATHHFDEVEAPLAHPTEASNETLHPIPFALPVSGTASSTTTDEFTLNLSPIFASDAGARSVPTNLVNDLYRDQSCNDSSLEDVDGSEYMNYDFESMLCEYTPAGGSIQNDTSLVPESGLATRVPSPDVSIYFIPDYDAKTPPQSEHNNSSTVLSSLPTTSLASPANRNFATVKSAQVSFLSTESTSNSSAIFNSLPATSLASPTINLNSSTQVSLLSAQELDSSTVPDSAPTNRFSPLIVTTSEDHAVPQEHAALSRDDVPSWTADEVGAWISSVKRISRDWSALFVQQNIYGEALLTLTDSELVTIGVDLLGDRKAILLAVKTLS